MSRFRPFNAGPTWKPRRCADCDRLNPTHNRDGGREGTPWRCSRCDATAEPLPPEDPFAAAAPAAPAAQGSLL